MTRAFDTSVEARLEALEAASKGPAPEAALEEGLKDPDRRVRASAALLAAACVAPGRLVDWVVQPEDFALRSSAMEALVAVGAGAIPALLAALERGGSGRIFILQVLGKIRAPEVVAALVRAAEGTDALVAQAAMEALGEQGNRIAVPLLIRALSREYWRAAPAVIALGKLRDPRAIAPLQRMSEDDLFREIATRALSCIEGGAA